tara:strand:- start:1029 stop:1172 length:144 start_codon:yes stop_codon:yes gene_type:complete
VSGVWFAVSAFSEAIRLVLVLNRKRGRLRFATMRAAPSNSHIRKEEE